MLLLLLCVLSYLDNLSVQLSQLTHTTLCYTFSSHTAYIRQYAWGTSLVTAPALNALSSLVVHAHCHKLIRLSATLPSFDAKKEITCNVHGVRSEFLDAPTTATTTKTESAKHEEQKQEEDDEQQQHNDPNDVPPSPVYFVGKVIWAKGFDHMLEVQEAYKEMTGAYFAMDVYGTGDDMKSIQRAFFGRSHYHHLHHRHHHHHHHHDTNDESIKRQEGDANNNNNNSNDIEEEGEDANSNTTSSGSDSEDSEEGVEAAAIFSQRGSLRDIVYCPSDDTEDGGEAKQQSFDERKDGAVEETTITAAAATSTGDATEDENEQDFGEKKKSSGALNLLGDLSSEALSTGTETADAVFRVIDSMLRQLGNTGKNIKPKQPGDQERASSSSKSEKDSDKKDETKSEQKSTDRESVTATSSTKPVGGPLRLARFKWRRTPLPARFLGVADHIIVRDLPQQKVFLNPSTTEVLCTTSAEAIAMSKFVILPRHRTFSFSLLRCWVLWLFVGVIHSHSLLRLTLHCFLYFI